MSTRQRKLTQEEIQRAFAEGAPPLINPILSTEEAAELLRIAPKTLDAWKNAGRLEGTYRKRGLVRYWRDRLIAHFFNGPDWTDDSST